MDYTYEQLCMKRQNGEISVLEFINMQPELLADYNDWCKIHRRQHDDASARDFIKYYEDLAVNNASITV